MESLKVTILYDLWEDAIPEPDPVKLSPGKKIKPVRKKKDPLNEREEIFNALTKLGYEPAFHILDGRNQSLLSLSKCSADPVLNLTDS